MTSLDPRNDPLLTALCRGLAGAAGPRLRSVVLYGSAARGDYHPGTSDLNVLVVLESLDVATLEAIASPVRAFVRKGQPAPRLFSPDLIAASADTFPVEFIDIRAGHIVLNGEDPFADFKILRHNLRLQIERELKEKMMRLREAYVLVHDSGPQLQALLVKSYPAFAALFRGGLELTGRKAPPRNHDAVAAFCDAAGLDRAPFEEVARLRRGERAGADPKTIFARYYDGLTRAADRVDRLIIQGGETR